MKEAQRSGLGTKAGLPDNFAKLFQNGDSHFSQQSHVQSGLSNINADADADIFAGSTEYVQRLVTSRHSRTRGANRSNQLVKPMQ